MLDKKFTQSISFKFLGIVSGILVISSVVISTVIATNEKKLLVNSLVTKGQGLSSFIARLSRDALIMKDTVQLNGIVNDASKDDEIPYILVHDAHGNALTSQYASINYYMPRIKAIVSHLPKDTDLAQIVSSIKTKEPITEISTPVMMDTDVIGKITIGMSEHVISRKIRNTMYFVTALNLAVMFALWVVLFIASKKLILNPIQELAHATVRVAKGDLTAQVKTKATGEVRVLVDSFNRMAEDLEKRTSELVAAQQELVRKEKLAILGQLSGSVGHELRNPLGVMSNAVYFLKMVLTDADETTREYLGIIEKEIGNSLRIINDLLDFARTKPPSRQAVAPAELVRQSLERCVIPEDVALAVDVPETLPMLVVDPMQMGQVLTNFITNGLQAMSQGGELRVAARRRARGSGLEVRGSGSDVAQGASSVSHDGDVVEISVEDTGEGISPENMRKLFQPLFTTKPKGIGLGLVVCKNLVEANGGRIDVRSEVGKGATFSVLLPVERREG